MLMTEERTIEPETEPILKILHCLPEKFYIQSELEEIALHLRKTTLSFCEYKPSLQVLFSVTNSFDDLIGIAHFEWGILKGIEQKRNVNQSKVGKRISYNFMDLEPDKRKLELERYLENCFPAGKDFEFIRIRYTDNMIENQKLSISLDFRNVNKNTGEELRINKDAEHSQETDILYQLRLEAGDDIGFHEIHISRMDIKAAISLLETDLEAVIQYRYGGNRKHKGLEAAKTRVKNYTYDKRHNQKEKALEELVKIIIDMGDTSLSDISRTNDKDIVEARDKVKLPYSLEGHKATRQGKRADKRREEKKLK